MTISAPTNTLNLNYLTVVSNLYPNVQCYAIGDPTVYANLVWESGNPIPPQSQLDAGMVTCAQTYVRTLINNYRDQVLNSGYTDPNGITWSSKPVDIQNLTGIITLISVGVLTGDQIWRDNNNVNHTMTLAQLVALAGGFAEFQTLCYQTSWTHKANIEALTTVAAVLAYDYTTGWP